MRTVSLVSSMMRRSAHDTVPLAINDNGLVTGIFRKDDPTYGFIYHSSAGTFKTLAINGMTSVSVRGVNNAGFAAVVESDGSKPSSFIDCPHRNAKCEKAAGKGHPLVFVN